MRRFQAIAIAAAVLIAAAPSSADASSVPTSLRILGTVTDAARPVSNALVIALNLQDLAATQVWTGIDGSFSLPSLRTGVYRIIAVKHGFALAMTTIVPTKPDQKIALRLEPETKGRKSPNQDIWELRGSLPADVLRDLDFALRPLELATNQPPRFRGEMLSLTGVATTPSSRAFEQTSLGLEGRIGNDWHVGVRGNLQRFDDPTDEAAFGMPLAESAVLAMEVRSSGSQSYRIASTRSSWGFVDGDAGQQQADVRAHNFEWRNGAARVQVRYFEQDHLFPGSFEGSNLIELEGALPLVTTPRNGLGVSLRVVRENVTSSKEPVRTADLGANGTTSISPSVVLHYGMDSRLGLEGQEFAPRTGVEWKLTKATSVVGSVQYKVVDQEAPSFAVPALVFWSDQSRTLPLYTYTLGVVSGEEGESRFSAIATFSAADDAVRVVFADELNQFWDGLYLDAGDLRRDLRLAYRREFGDVLAIDVATTAGLATSRSGIDERDKIYVTGDLQSTFNPTRTSLAVSYRELQQPLEAVDAEYRTERLHVRMAQSLYLPVDLKLLLGLELARSENSPYLIDALETGGPSRKYIGGLALNF